MSRVLDRRRLGVLLHPTSLPGAEATGALGAAASRFIDYLAAAGASVWQMLPIGPVHDDGSPYQSLSAHAGDSRLIDPRLAAPPYRASLMDMPPEVRDEFSAFCTSQSFWLDDYALFIVLREAHGHRAWWDWPALLARREPAALAMARSAHAQDIERECVTQFVFSRQWQALRNHARAAGVLLLGDLPIFVAHDSSDVWANPELFRLNKHGHCKVVAGVPPDYFSVTGQRWGNPLYDWRRMAKDGYAWWKARLRTELARFDLVRVDHFRGFDAYWEIPAEAPTAASGRWVKAPGEKLFRALRDEFGPLPLVAEDLGVITPEVEALRDRYGFPGMKILQFAFGGGADNPYLPHNHVDHSVIYTGTHDNDTTRGWFESLDPGARQHALDYLGVRTEDMPWALSRAALASVARLCVLPLQDILGLGSAHRMNRPGSTTGNWQWRFEWDQLGDSAMRLRQEAARYGRISAP